MPRLLVLYSANSPVCGVGTWIDSLVSQLPRHGWEVVVGLSQGRKFHRPELVEQHWPNWKTCRMDARTGTAIARRLAVTEKIKRVEPDLVLSTLLDDGLRAAEGSGEIRRRIRFAVANHGNAPPHLAAILEAAQHLDLVVSVNRASYELLNQWPGVSWSGQSLQCIPNAVPLPVASRVESSGPLRIGFVGRLAKDKGTDELPEIVRRLRVNAVDFHLTIAGSGPESGLISKLAAQYPECVTWRGTLNRSQLYQDIYPALDVILCCSPSEGWPMGVAEAMVHGAVPVSSEFSGIHQEGVIRHHQTGLIFRIGDSAGAAEAIRQLTDRATWQQLSRAASLEISSRFTLAQFGERWDKALRHCLSRPAKIPRNGSTGADVSWKDRFRERLRRLLGRTIAHDSVRAEWPMMAPRDPGLTGEVAGKLAHMNQSIPAHIVQEHV